MTPIHVKKTAATAVLSALFGLSSHALAGEYRQLSEMTNVGQEWRGFNLDAPQVDEEGIDAGRGYVAASVSGKMLYDSNLYNSDIFEKSSPLIVVTPRVRAEYDWDAVMVALNLQGEYGYYTASTDDNYFDWRVVGESSLVATERMNFYAGLGYNRGHDARGDNATEGFPFLTPEPRQFDEWMGRLAMKYGVEDPDAPHVELEYEHTIHQYTDSYSFPPIFSANRVGEIDDFDLDELGATFTQKVGTATALTVDGRLYRYDYDGGFIDPAQGYVDRDSDQFRILAGVLWDATANTEGHAKLGWGMKDMASNFYEDGDGVTWEVGVKWKPVSYSNLSASVSQDFLEDETWGWVDQQELRLAWNHRWDPSFYTVAIASFGEEDYAENVRSDAVQQYEIRGFYNIRPGLGIGAFCQNTLVDSNQVLYDSKDTNCGLILDVGLGLQYEFGTKAEWGPDHNQKP